uniref:Uncharacterized protein n=1 Tax=Lepeophtheirus salmonis TaxID=72036 RepID=A0A0K2UH62_LEPSM
MEIKSIVYIRRINGLSAPGYGWSGSTGFYSWSRTWQSTGMIYQSSELCINKIRVPIPCLIPPRIFSPHFSRSSWNPLFNSLYHVNLRQATTDTLEV